MSDEKLDETTPTSPDPAPAQRHGDAFLDESGSRHGHPPEPSSQEDEDDGDD
jgi:hypothetical protein